MKAPYRSELDALDRVYAEARGADVAELRRVAWVLGCGPTVFVGSGGSMVVARLAARLHECVCRQPAQACTPLETLDLPQLDDRGAMLFSSSAKHPDAQRVLEDFRRGRFRPSGLVTHRVAEDVQAVASPDTHVVTLPKLVQRDGFLATGSILQAATLLLRAYLAAPELPEALAGGPDDGQDMREDVLVLSGPSLAAVAADVEVRLVESGVACVQVADFRNFAHGRHTGFARRCGRTTVLVLSDRESQPLAEATAGLLPAGADVRRWHSDGPWESAVVSLLTRSMRLVATMAERAGVDVARPAVPVFGRRLYRLSLGRRVPDRLAGGIARKLLASGSGDHPAARAVYGEAAAAWTEALAEQRFSGLILDYDGTVCWTQRRWELPDMEVRDALQALLNRGLIIGIASGRGRSLHSDLRRWIPAEQWSKVVVGLYNGAVRLRLDDELPDLREPSDWSRSVVAALGGVPSSWRLKVEERGPQVSVAVAEGLLHQGRLALVLRDRLDDAGVGAQIVASGHSVDIVEPSSTKSAVADGLEQYAGGGVLAVGDQGQLGGNDHALLSRSSWTLSVERCSADLQRCWFAGSGDRVGPALLVSYLKALRKRRNGFVFTGLVVS